MSLRSGRHAAAAVIGAVTATLSLGFKPTATPHPARLTDEPEDIHITMAL